jgi:hypothetical protein
MRRYGKWLDAAVRPWILDLRQGQEAVRDGVKRSLWITLSSSGAVSARSSYVRAMDFVRRADTYGHDPYEV